MTLFSVPHATKVLALAVALAAGGMTAANAGDGRHDRHRGHHSRLTKIPHLEHGNHGGRLRTESRYANSDRQLWRGNRDFYGGAIAAYRDYGNDTYFYVDDDEAFDWLDRPSKWRESGPKVIVVTPGQNGCSWEAGVCVIRP